MLIFVFSMKTCTDDKTKKITVLRDHWGSKELTRHQVLLILTGSGLIDTYCAPTCLLEPKMAYLGKKGLSVAFWDFLAHQDSLGLKRVS